MNYNRGKLSGHGITVKFLLTTALGIQPHQITGIPSSIADKRYDFSAHLDNPSADRDPAEGIDAQTANIRLSQKRLLTILTTRFAFRYHVVQKDAVVYRMTVNPARRSMLTEGGSRQFIHSRTTPDGMIFAVAGQSMSSIAEAISARLGRKVIDDTGLSGTYGFELKYPASQDEGEAAASLLTALQNDSGLKLTRTKGTEAFYIVDNLQAPTPN